MHCETFALYSKCLQSLVFYNIIYGGLLTSVGNTVLKKIPYTDLLVKGGVGTVTVKETQTEKRALL